MKNRIYGSNINISSTNVNEFWKHRSRDEGLQSVLLGKSCNNVEQNHRNEVEKKLLLSLLEKHSKFSNKLSVLDLGCGIGRWYVNLKDHVEYYTGIDASFNFIKESKDHFKNEKNCNFCQCNLENLKSSSFKNKYDLVIITGVLMYINDNFIGKILSELLDIVKTSGAFYIQESVSTLSERLTLDKFYSSDLNCDYSAIYRTENEYKTFFKTFLNKFSISDEGILLDESSGARAETNAMYWYVS
jgi:ubiquinone/menaquinone biosynthesis C-methylase UbiE